MTRVLGAAARLANGGADPAPKHHAEAEWQAGLANADLDLSRLEARLAAADAPRRVSFCLEGPAGTGKSAWARHLARIMGLLALDRLTPGDFANTARRMRALGEDDPATILTHLTREAEAKDDAPRPVGIGR